MLHILVAGAPGDNPMSILNMAVLSTISAAAHMALVLRVAHGSSLKTT